VHVLGVLARDDGTLVLDVESDADLTGCPDCGVVAVGHGRRVQVLHDAPCFGRPVRVRWRKRIWRCGAEILAYFITGGVSNGGTEAINGVIEKTRRLAHGFRNFTNYRIRILLAADGSRPYRRGPAIRPEPC
jgi:transposase